MRCSGNLKQSLLPSDVFLEVISASRVSRLWMCARLASERREPCEGEAEVEVETPPLQGVIEPSLLCGCADCGISGKRVEGALPIPRARGSVARGFSVQGEEYGRIISPSLLCACEDCGVSGKRSKVWSRPVYGARGSSTRCLIEREEECPRRRSTRWGFRRLRTGREMKSGEMGTVWVPQSDQGERSGCGIQRVMEYVFYRDVSNFTIYFELRST